MLQAGIEILRVLAKDEHVHRHVMEARFQTRQHAHGAKVHIQAEFLAQSDVDALMPARDWRSGRPLQTDVRVL